MTVVSSTSSNRTGAKLDFSEDCCLLGNKGYTNLYQDATPYWKKTKQMAGDGGQVFRQLYTRELAQCNILVKHTISYNKKFQMIKECHQHVRWTQPIVDICGYLAQQHIQPGIDL